MSLDTNRAPYQKIILILLAAMTVIFAIWTGINRANEGVLFRETLLEISTQGDTTVYSGRVYGTGVTITCREENGTKYVNFSADGESYAACRVDYPGGTLQTEYGEEVDRIKIIRDDEVLFSGGYDPFPTVNNWAHYYNEDGTWNMDAITSIHTHTGSNPWNGFEFDLADIMRFAHGPSLSAHGSWGFWFLALVVTAICALAIAFPETSFYLNHFLSVRDPEPTDFFYACHKLGSFLSVGASLVMYLIAAFRIE